MAPPSPSSPSSPSLRTSSRAGLNRGPHPYQGCALPTELRERVSGGQSGTPLPPRVIPGGNSGIIRFSSASVPSAFPPLPPFQQSGRRDSNPRPSAWKADALPTELHPRVSGPAPAALLPCHGGGRIRTYVGQSPADLQSATISHSVTPPTSPGSLPRFPAVPLSMRQNPADKKRGPLSTA
jgi:hypothetical protein